jgi:hypothetical protein
MATAPPSRIDLLLQSVALNGIDFVEVPTSGQPVVRVHFLNLVALSGTVTNPQITGGDTIPTVAVNPIDSTDWSFDPEGRPILQLTAQAVGDFSFYTLSLTSPKLDQYYSTTVFSFRPNCNTNLDCDAPAPPCPPLAGNPPPIEYLAKDFLSFRQALLDFSALRYPQWQERAEADFGMMFLEALSGMADDLSYTQDRVAAEATLQTATQRRSIVRLARLVDYEPRPATSSTVLLQFNVTAGTVAIPAGVPVTGVTPDGQTVVFETGTGLADTSTYPVSQLWNESTNTPSGIAAAFTGYIGGSPSIAASFTGSISGATLTVSSVTGTIAAGQTLMGASIPVAVTITAGLGSTWTLSAGLGTIGSGAMTASVANNILTVTAISAGALAEGQTIQGSGVTATRILGYGPGTTGGVGTYLLDSQRAVASESMTSYAGESIVPYIWDASQVCLQAGDTAMWVAGHGYGFTVGMALLIDTTAQTPADPPIREIVHIVTVAEQTDELLGNPVTYFTWDFSEALQYDHDLTRSLVAGNLIPAAQGARATESFAIQTPPAGSPFMPLAIVRTGPNSTPASFAPMYLYSLANTPLAWLAPDATTSPTPEIMLMGQPTSGSPAQWPWYVNLLQAEQYDAGFTLDRASYIPIATNSDGTISYDYDGDSGDTIRFGDANFGTVPDPGTVFQVTYRTTSGAAGNLAADAVTGFAASYVTSVTNPFAATGGADEEPDLTVQRLAPQKFRANRYNAVLASDYAAAAQTLPWVERAGAVFRWTGSWLTVFTTADPEGSEQISPAEQLQLIQLVNRRRLAGYESYCPAPVYVSVDLEVYVCALATVFNADVQAAVQTALSTAKKPGGSTGFFYVDNFTFGQPLERSALEAAIQSAYGVAGVHDILYRQRGIIVNYIPLPDEVTIQPNQLLRVDNDPSRPERGSLLVYVDGGK